MSDHPYFTSSFEKDILNLSQDLCDKKYFSVKNVFHTEQLDSILHEYLLRKEKFRPAQIGKNASKNLSIETRSDSILWLNSNEVELKQLWCLLDLVVSVIRRELYLPIKRYESQFSIYNKGDSYARHQDKHKASPSRRISIVFYLNDWVPADGGRLWLYNTFCGDVKIDPTINSMVIFLSELEHEVMMVHKARRSFTVWLRDDVL